MNKFTFKAGEFLISQQDFLIILGFTIQNDLNLNKQVNETIKLCAFKLHCFHQISKFLNFKTRLQLINSIIIGKILYGLPLLMNTEIALLKKLNLVLIKSARSIIGSYCFRFSYNNIFKKVSDNNGFILG